MTKASEYLLSMAQTFAATLAALPQTKAVLVTGSVAKGEADFYSDIDMIVYYDALPSDEVLTEVRQQNEGGERLWILGEPAKESFAEAYQVSGVECQFAHTTIANWERDLAVVLERHEVESPLQKALSGILTAIPLYGNALIHHWQSQASAYPDELAVAMVKSHLRFWPRAIMQNMVVGRDDILWLHQMLIEAEQNILGILLGLNRIYHWGEYKRMDSFIAKMTIAPPDLSSRLKGLLHEKPDTAIALLCALILETLDLVALHMPQIDSGAVRERLNCPRPAWEPIV